MPEESAKNNHNPKPGSESEKDKTKRLSFRLFPRSKAVKRIVCGALTFVLCAIGAALLNSHPKPLEIAWGLIFTGLCFFAGGLRFELINHRTKHRMPAWFPNICCLTIIGLALVGCVFAILQEKREPRRSSAPLQVKPPSMMLITFPGIKSDDGLASNGVVQGDRKYLHLQTIFISNPNNVALLNISVRFQFPEPIVFTYPIERPAGTEVIWHPEDVRIAFGAGFTRIHSPNPPLGIEQVSSIYLLEMDKLPPLRNTKIDFLTSTRPELGAFFLEDNHIPDPTTGLFGWSTSTNSKWTYFLEGDYKYDSPTGIVSQDFWAPLVEESNRDIHLVPPRMEKARADVQHIMRPGF